ncbi:MAG: hypothetical protein GY818_08655 [Planctomycetaceae bacterium]|nr:hypothetical protein [Planctomycetaceae bacterium]
MIDIPPNSSNNPTPREVAAVSQDEPPMQTRTKACWKLHLKCAPSVSRLDASIVEPKLANLRFGKINIEVNMRPHYINTSDSHLYWKAIGATVAFRIWFIKTLPPAGLAVLN